MLCIDHCFEGKAAIQLDSLTFLHITTDNFQKENSEVRKVWIEKSVVKRGKLSHQITKKVRERHS